MNVAEQIDPEKIQKDILEALRRSQPGESQEEKAQADREEREEARRKEDARKRILDFKLLPRDVKKHLDRFVIRQEEAKRVLATAVCDHYRAVSAELRGEGQPHYVKQNIVMLGPTGVGKTYIIKCLAELIGVPFVKADATKFSETGYVGGDVEDLVRDLVTQAGGDRDLARFGMVYIDEVDKIASSPEMQVRDVSGSGVQRGLLKIMEDTDVSLRAPNDIQGQMQAMFEFQRKGKMTKPTLNTRFILFIVSGAFDGLGPIVERRLKSSQIGFSSSEEDRKSSGDLFRQVRTHDFVRFGLEPEFIGRLPIRVVCDPLADEDLYSILTASEGSILRQYEAAFAAYGITVRFEDQALWEIAKCSAEEATGARGLLTVIERVLRDLKYELPSTSLREFTLTREMVVDPSSGMAALLEEGWRERRVALNGEVRAFEDRFAETHGFRIRFDDEALGILVQDLMDTHEEPAVWLERRYANYGYGLGLVRQKNDAGEFLLQAEAAREPNRFLDHQVKHVFGPAGEAP